MKKQWLALEIFVFSLICHLMAYWLIEQRYSGVLMMFEIRVLVLLGGIGSLSVFLVNGIRYFRIAHWLHLGVLLFASFVLSGIALGVELLLAVPYMIESASYENIKPGILTIAASTVALAVCDAFMMREAPGAEAALHLALLSLGTLASGGSYSLVTYYREEIVTNQRAIDSLNSAFEKLSSANLGLQDYASHAESKSARKERARVTRELHDSVGYGLTNVVMAMNAAKIRVAKSPESVLELLDNTKQIAENCLRETRMTLYRLRAIKDTPTVGLRALAGLVSAFRIATTMDVELQYGSVPFSLGHEVDATLYRLVQEGLTNAYRHGGASRMRISLWLSEGWVHVRIRDNGTGVQEIREGIGLQGMRERFESFGGTINPHNTVDGFELSATLPLPREEDCE